MVNKNEKVTAKFSVQWNTALPSTLESTYIFTQPCRDCKV